MQGLVGSGATGCRSPVPWPPARSVLQSPPSATQRLTGSCFIGVIASGSFTCVLLTIAIIMAAGLAVLLTARRRAERLGGTLSS
jgi:hypothetical protein